MMARSHPRLIVLITTFAVSGVVLLGRQPPQTPPAGQLPPEATFRSSIAAVQLTVVVTDNDGKPVPGLTQADFEVLESGATRPITTFAAVDIPLQPTERGFSAPDVLTNDRPPGRTYIIALDTMSPTNALRARWFLRQFVEKYFGPNDTAAVVLTTRGLADSGQAFTSNPRLLLAAIDKFGGDFPDEWRAHMRERNFIGDFRALMSFVANLRGGRKAVIFVSEGIPVDAYDVANANVSRFGGLFSEVDTEFVEALSFATRNNIAIYPVDPRGLTTELTAPESFDTSALDNRVVMGGLAAVTGGFALTGSNNYAGAFERLVSENSTYYLVGFNSGVEQRDGRFVGVEVRVKRPGLQVRTVDGYVAPRGRPPEQRRPSTVLAAVWDAAASGITTSGVPMRVYAAPFRGIGRGKDATVAIAVEISGAKLNLVEQNGAHRGVLELIFTATDAKKKRWPIWRHRAELALKPETYTRVSSGALRVVSQMPLPAGRYQLRASAGNANLAGSVLYDLEIPDFREAFSLSGVALTSMEARETLTFSPDKRIDVALPGPPTTAREFSQDDTLTVFAEAYENRRKPHTVTVTIELRDATGRVLGTHVIERKAIETPKDVSAYPFAPNLSLQDVPPGRYAIHVDARSSLDKHKSVTRDITFSVR